MTEPYRETYDAHICRSDEDRDDDEDAERDYREREADRECDER